MSACNCDLRTRLVGDGCAICNPTLVAELEREDLFGEAPLQPVIGGKGSRGGRRPGLNAYPAQPGTGPEGKCCRDCIHKTRAEGTSKTFLKCALMRPAWTHGYGTDIKARSPACSKFEERA